MIRRFAAYLCVFALAIAVMADVKAQSGTCTDLNYNGGSNGTSTGLCASREAAYNYAEQTYLNLAQQRVSAGTCPPGVMTSYAITQPAAGSGYGRYSVNTDLGNAVCRQTTGTNRYWRLTQECPAGSTWNDIAKKCDAPCNTKPPMLNVRFQVVGGTANTTCSGGCEYAVDLQGGTGPSGLTTIAGVLFYRAASMSPTGGYCTVGNEPITNDSQGCVQQGNLTQCLKPDGQHCATASSGKQFCWQPGENGIKASGNDAATKSPDGTTPKPPPLPPNNGGEWTQTGQSTVVTDVNNQTQSSTVTGWQSNYGSQGQGANGNGASGEGNAGNGSGSGLGNGNGNGNGDDEGDDDGPGAPGAGVDDLYSPTDKTVASVFAAFKARVGEAPMMDAIDSFFTVSASGSCPTWTVPASAYNEAMTLDWHCSGNVLTALIAIGWVIMALAAFFAAMWALS